jgi:hypothetical protein
MRPVRLIAVWAIGRADGTAETMGVHFKEVLKPRVACFGANGLAVARARVSETRRPWLCGKAAEMVQALDGKYAAMEWAERCNEAAAVE